MEILASIIIGATLGWLSYVIVGRNDALGFLGHVIVGMVGAVLGNFTLYYITHDHISLEQPITAAISASFVGALILLTVINLVTVKRI